MTRIEQFVQQARTIAPNDVQAIQALCAQEHAYLLASGRSELTVQKKDMPRYKAALREAGIVRGYYVKDFNELWLHYLTFQTDALHTYKAQYEHQRSQRIRGGQYIIRNAVALVDQAVALVKTGVGYQVVAGLCLLTGRRESEIGITASFVPCTNDEYHVEFRGQLKGSDAKRLEKIIIPVLADRDLVCDALQTLRAMYPHWAQMDTKRFDAIVGSDVRKTVKRVFGPFFPDCPLSVTAHLLRKAYAAMAEHKMAHLGWSQSGYIASIMGHAENDDTNVKSYQFFGVAE